MSMIPALQAALDAVAARDAAIDAAIAALSARVAALEAVEPPAPPPPDPEVPDPDPPTDPEDPPEEPEPPVEPPPSPTGNLLLDVAATLEPGEWRRVPTTWPGKETGRTFKGFQTVSGVSGGSADGMGWTERLVEYQGALMLPFMRDDFRKALGVMDAAGNWKRIEQPAGWSPTKSERRPFNRWFRDDRYAYFSPADAKTSMGYFLRTPLEDPGVFERFGIAIGDDQMDSVGNFSACLAHEWGRFYAYTPGGKLRSWAEGEIAWASHASHIPQSQRNTGYAGTVIWNPIKREVIAIGGQYFGTNPDVSYRVLRLTSPAPDAKAEIFDAYLEDGTRCSNINAGGDRFIVHPMTGEYLMLYGDGKIYRSHDARVWREYQDLSTLKPWGAYEKYCPWTHLSGTPDVLVMVSHIMGVWLHRMKDDEDEPPAPPPPAPEPSPAPEPAPAPTEPPMSDLASLIASMAPGERRLLDPATQPFKVTSTQGTYWTIDWTPRMHWDSARQQLVKFGKRIICRAVAWKYGEGWREFPLPEALTTGSANGHWYGWSAHDGADTIFALGYLVDLVTETNRKVASIPLTTNGSNGTMTAWLSSVGRFVRYGGDARRWMEYDPVTNTWPVVKSSLRHGQHALLEYNPVDDRGLLVGGNPVTLKTGETISTTKSASLVAPGGVLTPLPDLPQRVSMATGSWIIALPGGGWMVRCSPTAPEVGHVYRISAAEPEWVDMGEWPKIGLQYHQAAFAPEFGAVFVATTTGLHVWKLPEF